MKSGSAAASWYQARLFNAYAHIRTHQTEKTSLFGIIVRGQPQRVVVHSAVLFCRRLYCPHCQTRCADKAQSGPLPLGFWGGAGADLTALPDKVTQPEFSRQSDSHLFRHVLVTFNAWPGHCDPSLPCARLDSLFPLAFQVLCSTWQSVRRLFWTRLYSRIPSLPKAQIEVRARR